MNLFDDNYLGNSNEVRIIYIYIWFGDSFDNDDCFAYTFEMMNCTCWVKYVKRGIRWVTLSLIDVDKWWAYVDDLIRDWICLLC